MSCPRTKEVLAGTPAAGEHAKHCAECTEAIALLEDARKLVGSGRPAMPGEAHARMWRVVEAAGARSRFPLPRFIPAVCFAAVAALVYAMIFRPPVQETGKPPPLVSTADWVVQRGEVSRSGLRAIASKHSPPTLIKPGLELQLMPGAEVMLEPSALVLEAGALELSLQQGVELAVVTADVRVLCLAGSSQVSVDREGTTIEVHSGIARIAQENVAAPAKRRIERARPPLESTPVPVIAEKVRVLRPQKILPSSPPVDTFREVDRLARHADALRKEERLEEAILAYAELALRQDAPDYAEEALYRAAKLSVELDRRAEAEQYLARAKQRFPNGALAPERAALEEALQK